MWTVTLAVDYPGRKNLGCTGVWTSDPRLIAQVGHLGGPPSLSSSGRGIVGATASPACLCGSVLSGIRSMSIRAHWQQLAIRLTCCPAGLGSVAAASPSGPLRA